MANQKAAQKQGKKARKVTSGPKAKVATSPGGERQQERQNETGRGSGEGKSGLRDGHPTGR